MTQDELRSILENHQLWVDSDGQKGEEADLSGANLRRADLSGADLSRAYLYEADLRRAYLYGAYLYGADLSRAYLYEADLRRAHLCGANLHEAVLCYTDLSGADLCYADLSGADLCGADLRGADLRGADLRGVDLSRACLSGACLSGAYMDEHTLDLYFPLCCPESGSFIAWKKAENCIIKLMVTEDAKRSSAFGRKCRCSKAICLAIENFEGTDSGRQSISSSYDSSFIYEIGKTVEVPNFDENRTHECAPGIHFFITRQEAVNY